MLRIPRQVRDYVSSLITEEEYSDITYTATDLLFGPNWREGKIKLTKMAQLGMKFAMPIGPGNEHAVAYHLIWAALQKKDELAAKQAASLAIYYCGQLFDHDRFKDACKASAEIYHLIEGKNLKKEFTDIALIYGKSLRMTHKRKEAVQVLQSVLGHSEKLLNKEMKASAYLNIALALKNIERTSAISFAEQVLELKEKESAAYMHAKEIILECKETSADTKKELLQLEQKARKKGFTVLSNNTLLNLMRKSDNTEEKLRFLEQILQTREDDYNHIIAIITKAEILIEEIRTNEINSEDRHLLSLAYTHLYYQWLQDLFNRCHNVIWKLMKHENQLVQLLRIFRHSSFLWRILGDNDLEKKYLKELNEIDLTSLQGIKSETLHSDLRYLELRKSNLSGN